MSKRILVVEDQPDNRQIIRDMLAPTDYEITEAENGEQALAAIAKQRPDLLRSIPIIAVTSYALSGEEKKARAAGCDDANLSASSANSHPGRCTTRLRFGPLLVAITPWSTQPAFGTPRFISLESSSFCTQFAR
jgi:two-component system cell cycle response regulator DivK